MADIRLQGINKYFGKMHAVRDLDLVIRDHGFHTLLGPSGCGKTTTLRMIAGLERPSTGHISVGKRVVYSSRRQIMLPPAKRDIGLIFQDYALWPHMTVAANVSFGLEVQKLARTERRQRIESILKRVQLEGLEDRHPSELSGGQQQRVAMARMLVVEPEVLLMDEPLSNLDAKLRLTMRSELKKLHRDIDATTVYVTHDQREALSMSDCITVMYNGSVQQNASPKELYEKPANLFVAGFVGSPAMNLLPGRILEISSKGMSIELEKLQYNPILIDRIENVSTGDSIVLGIRPEDVTLDDRHAAWAIPGIVSNVLPTGSETIVEIGQENATITAQVNRKIPIEHRAEVRFSFQMQEIHLFNAKSGLRLN